MKNGFLNGASKYVAVWIIALAFSHQGLAETTTSDCVLAENTQGYCYEGIPDDLDPDTIAVTAHYNYGFEARTVVEFKKREDVLLTVICANGFSDSRTVTRVTKDERRLLSEISSTKKEAVTDLRRQYFNLRKTFSRYLCEE